MKPEILGGQFLLIIVTVVAVGLAVFYRYLYRKEARQARQLTPWQRRILWFLRIVVGVLALLAITRPAVYWKQVKERLPVVAFLVDESSSMDFPDTRDNPLLRGVPKDERKRFGTCQKVLNKLQKDLTLSHRVKVFTFSDTMRLLRELPHRESKDEAPMTVQEIFKKTPEAKGEYSNIGDGLSDVMRNLSSHKISGIVLMSDGRQTGGKEIEQAAQQAANALVPVHTVVTGTEFPLRDLRIDEVDVEAEASLGDVLIFNVKVTNQIRNRLSTEITLFEEGKKVNTKRVTLERGTGHISLAMIPETEGTREFKIELPVYRDEINTENNKTIVHVKVVKKTLKVMVIASKPTREYFFMIPALLRDPVVELSCFLQSCDVDYVQQGNKNIERLPKTMEGWRHYDVLVLFDANPNKISTQQITAIENMVRKGGGLIVVAGRNYGLAKFIQVHAVRARNMLPVEIDKNQLPNYFKTFENPFRVKRTPMGKGHPIMLASNDSKTNEDVWSTFPQFMWHHPVEHVKSTAITLLEKTSGAEKIPGKCIMAIQRYGEGAVLYSGINSLWKWHFPFENFEYDRFWVRAIRYMGETRLKGTQQQVALDTDRLVYAPGEDVKIDLRVLDPALMAQLKGQPVFAAVTSSSKDKRMVRMKPDAGGEMRYTGHYRARRVGSMLIKCRQAAPNADSEAKPLFEVSHAFRIKMESLEAKDTSADLEAMQNLASMTKGEYFDYKNMDKVQTLIEKIPKKPQQITKTILVELWDGLTFLILFLVLICGEWSLRKLWGLL